ncbi:MAG TPA: DUF402 domain-containing protein [Chloroflexi bacterium]|nr:DUF402 domain-containing protein [Chloroflexota bacterium]
MAQRVTITKVGHGSGRAAAVYAGEVVHADEGVTVVRCPWTREAPLDLGPFVLEAGDVFLEYYFRDEWFSVFQIHGADGALKGWYGNITAPAEIGADAIRWIDLALDLLVLPDGRALVVDEDEFTALALSPDTARQARAGLARLQRWVRERRPPFDRIAEPRTSGGNA